MTRRPMTQPERVHRGTSGGGGSRRLVIPTIRPTAPLENVKGGDWLPFRDAVSQLSTLFPAKSLAYDYLWLRIFNGVLPVTCETLVYERADNGPRTRQVFAWPGSSARLGEQMLMANGHSAARFRWAAISGDVQWADVTGEYPVNALALNLHVDRAFLMNVLSEKITSATGGRLKLFDRSSSDDDVGEWYKARVKKAPPQGYSRDEDYAAGAAVGISQGRMSDLRKRFAPSEWKSNQRNRSGRSV